MAVRSEHCEISQAESEQGCKGGGVAKAGEKEVKGQSREEQLRVRRQVGRRRKEMELRVRSAEQRRVEREEKDAREKEEEEQRAQRERERQVTGLMTADRERESYMDRVRRRQAGWESEEEEEED